MIKHYTDYTHKRSCDTSNDRHPNINKGHIPEPISLAEGGRGRGGYWTPIGNCRWRTTVRKAPGEHERLGGVPNRSIRPQYPTYRYLYWTRRTHAQVAASYRWKARAYDGCACVCAFSVSCEWKVQGSLIGQGVCSVFGSVSFGLCLFLFCYSIRK